jgi:hypothetical protein
MMMKKSTRFLLTLAAMAAGTGAYAQKNCNLQLTLVSPTNNQQIPFTVESDESTKVYVKFNIKNHGPDAIAPTDTIYYISEFSGTLRSVQGLTIASGATQLWDPQIYINNTVTADETRDYCLRLFPQTNVYNGVNGTDTNWVTVTYNDSDTSNNRGCSTVILKKQGSISVAEMNQANPVLSVYPNPARDAVHFRIGLAKTEHVSVSVRDITGRIMLSNDFGRMEAGETPALKLDVSTLTSGLYFVELRAGDKKANGKFTIER